MIDEQEQASGEIGRAVAAILAARPTFKVGDRVRIRLSGECRGFTGPLRMGSYFSHWAEQLDGRIAVVREIHHPDEAVLDDDFRLAPVGDHRIMVTTVEFVDWRGDDEPYQFTGVYAPEELERLDP